MGSTLSTINILSNIALQQKSLDEEKSKQYLSTISQSTHQMMEAMDDIVWSINPTNDNIGKIVARMKETAGSVLESRNRLTTASKQIQAYSTCRFLWNRGGKFF